MGSGRGVSDAPTGVPGLGFPPSLDISAPQTHNLVLPSLRFRLTFSREQHQQKENFFLSVFSIKTLGLDLTGSDRTTPVPEPLPVFRVQTAPRAQTQVTGPLGGRSRNGVSPSPP